MRLIEWKLIEWGRYGNIYLTGDTVCKVNKIESIHYNEKNVGMILQGVKGIVQHIDSDDTKHVIKYKYIEGKELDILIRTMSESEIIHTMREIGDIMLRCLAKGVYPKDVHRNNIIIGQGTITVIDLGSYVTEKEKEVEVPTVYRQVKAMCRMRGYARAVTFIEGLEQEYIKVVEKGCR